MRHFFKRIRRLRCQAQQIETLEYVIVKINEALDAALVQTQADKKEIAILKDEVAAAVDPVKAKALADTVLGVDSATLPPV